MDESPPQPPTMLQRAINGEVLCTKEQLADYLQVSEVTLWNWRKAGMPFSRGPKQHTVRFSIPAVNRWLADNAKNFSAE